MNDSDREKLVDYVLGRLTETESAALESRALADPDLARRLRDLWRELEIRPNVLPRDGDRQRKFLARLESLGTLDADESPANVEDAVANFETPKESETAEQSAPTESPKTRRRRFLFIPKRVSAPLQNREEDAALVFKRAVELTPEERERRRQVARRARAAAGRGFVRRSIFSRERVDYLFVDDLPRLDACLVATRRFRFEPARTVAASFDLASYEPAFDAVRPRLDESYLAQPVELDFSPTRSVAAASDVPRLAFAPGRLAAPIDLRAEAPVERVEFFSVDVGEYAAYLARPLEYTRNGVRVVDFVTPYRFEEFDAAPSLEPAAPSPTPETLDEVVAPAAPVEPSPTSILESPRVEPVAAVASPEPNLPPEPVATPAPNLTSEPVLTPAPTPELPPRPLRPVALGRDILPVASRELVDLISAAIGQSPTYIQQNGAAYVSAKPDLDDEAAVAGTTVSAENLRLAELLGREPTAIDLEEYYWEDVDAEEEERELAFERRDGLLKKLFYLATSPSVLVGRATIRVFRTVFPRDLERDEACRETRRSKNENAGGISDMVISLVAGVLIAACVVFPLLHKVVRGLYDTIAESAVREYGGRVALPSNEALDLDVTDMMLIDQILHPSYESMEINEGGDYENDGLPMSF